MKIQPITSWQNGEEKQAINFELVSNWDNLKDSASFNYYLSTSAPPDPLNPNLRPETLVSGSLSIGGQDYIDWGKATDVNQWAYEWAASQLNLTLIPDETIA
jgi:hypothetical protein